MPRYEVTPWGSFRLVVDDDEACGSCEASLSVAQQRFLSERCSWCRTLHHSDCMTGAMYTRRRVCKNCAQGDD